MSVCKRAIDIPPFIVMEVLERAKVLEAQGKPVIHMEVGEPDFDSPGVVIDAAVAAMRAGRTHYTHSLGELELRETIAKWYRKKYGVTVDPGHIVVTQGTSPAMLILFAALLDPGDEIVMGTPHYPCYPNYINFLGGCPVYAVTREDDGFQLQVAEVKRLLTERTKAVLINSPSNPTGQILSDARMAELAGLGRLIISDEIYHGLVYGGRARSILEFTDEAVVLNGFSKLYAMTGWRLGWIIAPERLVRPLQKIHQNFFISANSFCQAAGIAALEQADQDAAEMVSRYDARRKIILDRLARIGLVVKVPPTGAFYVLANAGHIHKNSYELAFDILERALVGVAPGIDFGPHAEGYLRFSYATGQENIVEAMDRLERYFKEQCPWR